MKTDVTTKMILGAIALGLLANAVKPLVRPVTARAASNFTCKGKLVVSEYGATAYRGGYDVDVTCEP